MTLRFAVVVIAVFFVGAPSLESIGARAQQTACERACTAAASPYDPEVIRSLIQQGNNLCSCNCASASGGGVLHVAARSGCVLCINLLTSSPSNCLCDDRDYAGSTPLHVAASVCNGPTTSTTIAAGCNADAQRYRTYDTPLCLAARRRNDDNCGQVVRTLLSTNSGGGNADPCLRCLGGTTACQSCAYRNTCNVLEQDGACNC